MNNDAIIKDILEDINNMSLAELKKVLLENANGPIYQAMSFNPYEAIYDCFYANAVNYKLAKVFNKKEFLKLINNLDTNSRVAARMSTAAANDEFYKYNLAA
ncbi:hypothetical protein HGG78_14635 [Vibrio aestuarianus]|uniref:hypothetical protein n=1 Tax=Vibrio aestuarianus TaxID=28171 RepID=UPI001559000C|nr:hypothetical protein [Vibrio aestuarianus]NGZ14972.1 hypothetical protein [Vibrio aestuarianus]NKZ51120.1 hypothetical protein [Vibrio aestuarianus]